MLYKKFKTDDNIRVHSYRRLLESKEPFPQQPKLMKMLISQRKLDNSSQGYNLVKRSSLTDGQGRENLRSSLTKEINEEDLNMRAAIKFLRLLGSDRRNGMLVTKVENEQTIKLRTKHIFELKVQQSLSPIKDVTLSSLKKNQSPINLNSEEEDYIDFTKEYRKYDENRFKAFQKEVKEQRRRSLEQSQKLLIQNHNFEVEQQEQRFGIKVQPVRQFNSLSKLDVVMGNHKHQEEYDQGGRKQSPDQEVSLKLSNSSNIHKAIEYPSFIGKCGILEEEYEKSDTSDESIDSFNCSEQPILYINSFQKQTAKVQMNKQEKDDVVKLKECEKKKENKVVQFNLPPPQTNDPYPLGASAHKQYDFPHIKNLKYLEQSLKEISDSIGKIQKLPSTTTPNKYKKLRLFSPKNGNGQEHKINIHLTKSQKVSLNPTPRSSTKKQQFPEVPMFPIDQDTAKKIQQNLLGLVKQLGIKKSDNHQELRPAPQRRRRTTGFLAQLRSNSETKQNARKLLENEEFAKIKNLHFDYSRFRNQEYHQISPRRQLIKDFAITLKKTGCN